MITHRQGSSKSWKDWRALDWIFLGCTAALGVVIRSRLSGTGWLVFTVIVVAAGIAYLWARNRRTDGTRASGSDG